MSPEDTQPKIIPQERITVYCSQQEYRQLKAKLALKGIAVTEWFRRKVKEELSKISTED